MTIGSLIGALVLATLAYRVALAFVIARRRHPHFHVHVHVGRRHRDPGAGDREKP